MQRTLFSITGIIILGGILLLLNSISNSIFSRFYVDLTEENLYTLSSGSRNIVKSIKEPVSLRFYFSKTDSSRYPNIKLYATRVEDLLKEYDRIGGEMVELETYDPRPDSEEEEWAQKFGLTPLQLPTGDRLYLGLAAINSLGEEEVIPIFNFARQEFLEYDISKILYSLSSPEKPVVAVISPLKIEGETAQPQPGMPPQGGSQPWILASQISKTAELRYLGTDVSNIEEDIDVLMVIHPKNLPEQTRYAVDQFAMRGGNLFIAVDPYCALDQSGAQPGNPMAGMFADRSSNLPELLSAWGVTLMEKQMVADANLGTQVSAAQGQQPELFAVWLTLDNAAREAGLINRDIVAVADIDTVMFPWSGALELQEIEGITIEPLFKTTDEAVLLQENDYRFAAQNPSELLRKIRPGGQQRILAARIHGRLKSAFPNRPGAGDASMSTESGHIPEGREPATVIVTADADFLGDQYSAAAQNFLGTRIVSLLNDNLVFAANAVENLAGSDDLISLRSRGRFTRPFTKVREIESAAAERWRAEEQQLQAKLNEANRRLSELQGGAGMPDSDAVFTNAVLEEIKRFREERQEAQRRLREVRRNLRQDKEALGTRLFLLNTFGVPLLLVIGTLYYSWRKRAAAEAAAAENGIEQEEAAA